MEQEVIEHQQYPWFERRTILRGLVGSTAHGLHTDDGVDDRDEMGICIEPMANMIGPYEFEQVIYRTAAEREGKQDAKSRAGDLDLTVYSLRKWTRLALQGNPTVLMLLFVPPEMCPVRTALASHLSAMSDHFVSREAGQRFLGYLTAQKQRMLGERGSKGVQRPELVEKYGYDTKYAMHMVRLGMQGVEFMKTGRMTLPMAEPERSWIRSIRVGKVSQQDVLTRAGELEREIKDLLNTPGPLPDTANAEPVWAWVRSVYMEWWKCDQFGLTYGAKQ
jgi:predicted nucleotidyltransferase